MTTNMCVMVPCTSSSLRQHQHQLASKTLSLLGRGGQLAALAPEARAKVQEALKDSASGQLNRSATFIFGAAGRNCASRVWQSTWRGGLPCATSRTTRCRNC